VSDYLPDDAIADVLRTVTDPDVAASLVVAAALQAGSRDNVTAVVADVIAGASQGETVTFAGAAADRFTEGAGALAG
jgi:protein phosphatase